MSFVSFCLIIVVSCYFFWKRALRYLRFFQQDEYSPERFLKWFFEGKNYDHRGSTIAAVGIVLSLLALDQFFAAIVSIPLLVVLVWVLTTEPNPLIEGKLKLVLTQRVKRIFYTACIVYFLLLILAVYLSQLAEGNYSFVLLWFCQVILFQSVPFVLIVAIKILQPDEQRRQRSYLVDAHRIVSEVDPFIIGITGSYGKSSVKNILGELLQVTDSACFWPPKGVNTLMGVTAAIRSRLTSSFKYAVVEMAAYRRGSIKKLCELTPPKAGIITAIGIMHLERFGNAGEIYTAKTELAASIPEDGILVCNGDDEGARKAAKEYQKQTTILYGFNNKRRDLDCWISKVKVTEQGTSFKVRLFGKEYEGTTSLIGKPALSNAMAAFAMACALGAQPEFVLGAICNLKPLENRLSLRKADGITYLMDAYNSNPIGFTAALDVLAKLPGKRRILFTPGMIELGDQQYEENKKLASYAAKICDQAFLIGTENQSALHEGLKSGGMSKEQIVLCETRDDGFSVLNAMLNEGDLVLIENDLTDLHEGEQKF